MTSQSAIESVANASSKTPTPREFPWATVPYWFAAIAGLTYATGFLVEFTFQHALGITVSLDVFKAKYIYIGLQCLQFPASVMLLVFGFRWAKTRQRQIEKEVDEAKIQYAKLKDQDAEDEKARHLRLRIEELEKDDFRVVFSFVVAMCGLLLVFYLATTFSRPQEWPKMQLPVALLSLGITVLLSLIRGAEGLVTLIVRRFGGERSESVSSDRRTLRKIGRVARVALLVPEYVAIALICQSPIWLFCASFMDGGYFYLLFVLLVFLMLGFLQGFLPVFRKHRRAGALLAMNLSVTFSFLYLSILSYAYHIYPYLPTSRGGGDYSADLRACILNFTSDSIASIPEAVIDNDSLQSKPLTLLEDTVDAIFVTLEYTEAERKRWRLVGIKNKPQVIYSLKKDSIVDITYQDITTTPPPKPRPHPTVLVPPPGLSSVASPSPTATAQVQPARKPGFRRHKPSTPRQHP